jgi:hypothetical protein
MRRVWSEQIGRRAWPLLAALVFASACTTKQQNKCSGDGDCTNPAYPFCDVDGEFSTSGGEKNVCTIVPPECPVERCGCSPGATTCTGDQLTTCDAGGTSETSTTCALGCATDGTRCQSFEPSNGLGPALTAAANEPAVTIPDGATINTDTGEVKNSGGIAIPVNSLSVAQGSGTIRALIGASFSIGDIVVTGNSPLAIVSVGEVTLNGVLDASANVSGNGPGAQLTAPCAGHPGDSGGGGGGNATDGGAGGLPGNAMNPRAAGGAAQAGFEPLLGGCPGGALTSGASIVSDGGGGGGGVQIVSLSTITIAGGVDIGGGGGGYDGGGGGAGGNVILEAPGISFSGGGIFANGGSGGACSAAGNDATRDMTPAAGVGPCGGSVADRPYGGPGGTVSSAPGAGGRTLQGSSGGGGGAVGRVRIATRDGTFDAGTATLSAALTMATLTTK